ncbi:unnamed protein product [Peronospora belbahrii]|uniref:TBC1 domain family member 23 n=1 Tax=Peronospora belbahrii TaxID=622444 RepID=A0AAU9KU50_9STRA|nr:unnamed protein product [Peronospora belbahrii]
MKKRRPDRFLIGLKCRLLGEIPSDLRSQVWKELLGVARSERVYLDQSILQVEEDLRNQRVIRADAARTRSNERRFQQPETVEVIVKLLTYYCKCRSIQYKQGMNEVLAPFLLLTEERQGCEDRVPLAEGVVFQCFYALIDRFLPHVFVDKEFRSLQCSFQLFRLLMLYHDPELCHYLDQHDMTPELYVTPWFMTLFARSLPPEFVFYLWDIFLLQEDPYLLHFVAYALVAANREQIFQAEIPMLPQVLSTLTFSSRIDLEQVCASALVVAESTPRSFKRDLYSVCYGGFTDAMVPFLDQLYVCSSLQVYPEELVRNLLDRLKGTKSEQHVSVLAPIALSGQDNPFSEADARNPSRSSRGDRPPLLYLSGNGNRDESTGLKFIVLDCRPAEEYHKLHLSLSHYIDPSIMGHPDALDKLMKGFFHMKGCHFCFVGRSVDSPSILSRSSSDSVALKTIVRLASVILNDTSQHLPSQDPSQRSIDVVVTEKDDREISPSASSPTEPAATSCNQSPGEPGTLPSEIDKNGVSEVHAEYVSVTQKLVLLFLQKGFKHVSRLDGGFDELEKNIRNMDTFAQEQLLVASPQLPPTYEQPILADLTETASKGGFNLFSKRGRSRQGVASKDDVSLENDTNTHAEISDGNSSRFSASKGTDTLFPSVSDTSTAMELKERKKKPSIKITTSSAVSTLSQRFMFLKAAAKDAVSLSSSSLSGTNSQAAVETNALVKCTRKDGWMKARVKKDEVIGTTFDVKIQPGPIGISFRKSRTSKKYQTAVDSLVPDSQAFATALITAGDLLVAINGKSLKNKAFLTVIKLIIEASRPVVLRFLTPISANKKVDAPDVMTTQPLAPKLVCATGHSLCVAWDKLSFSSSTTALYQLEYAKNSGDGSHSWLPVVIKQEGATDGINMSNVTDQTNGTMIGLEPGESVVFRVRCRGGQRWGPYSLSSSSMRTLDGLTAGASKSVSGFVIPTLVSRIDLATVIFLPGVCAEYVERGQFFYRVLQASQARRRPSLNSDKLDITLEKGQVVRGSERLVNPGENQIFVRLTIDNCGETGNENKDVQGKSMLLCNGQREADDDGDGVWAYENTSKGDVVLERLPESAIAEIEPLLREQAKPMVQSFLSSHNLSPTSSGSFGDNIKPNSAAPISVVISSAALFSHAIAPPHILQAIPASSFEIVVTWDSVNEVGVAKYQIQYMKDRLAAMWWTVKPDISAETCRYSVTGLQPNTLYIFRIRSGTEDNIWSQFSDLSESCRTFPSGVLSADGASSDEDSEASIVRQPVSSDRNNWSTTSSLILAPAPQNAPVRTGSTMLDKAVAVASRLSIRSLSSYQIETLTDEEPLNNKRNDDTETQQHVVDENSELELPESRYVNLADWKSSSRIAHKDFRFYHVTKFEERDDCSHQLLCLGHRELVVAPSLLVILNVMVATREGFALVEEWRPLTSLIKVSERDDLNNALVFHFKDRTVSTPDSTDNAIPSNQLIVVVEGAQACAKVVQDYCAMTVNVH